MNSIAFREGFWASFFLGLPLLPFPYGEPLWPWEPPEAVGNGSIIPMSSNFSIKTLLFYSDDYDYSSNPGLILIMLPPPFSLPPKRAFMCSCATIKEFCYFSPT